MYRYYYLYLQDPLHIVRVHQFGNVACMLGRGDFTHHGLESRVGLGVHGGRFIEIVVVHVLVLVHEVICFVRCIGRGRIGGRGCI